MQSDITAQVGGKAGIWAGGMGIGTDGTRIFFATVSLRVYRVHYLPLSSVNIHTPRVMDKAMQMSKRPHPAGLR